MALWMPGTPPHVPEAEPRWIFPQHCTDPARGEVPSLSSFKLLCGLLTVNQFYLLFPLSNKTEVHMRTFCCAARWRPGCAGSASAGWELPVAPLLQPSGWAWPRDLCSTTQPESHAGCAVQASGDSTRLSCASSKCPEGPHPTGLHLATALAVEML